MGGLVDPSLVPQSRGSKVITRVQVKSDWVPTPEPTEKPLLKSVLLHI